MNKNKKVDRCKDHNKKATFFVDSETFGLSGVIPKCDDCWKEFYEPSINILAKTIFKDKNK